MMVFYLLIGTISVVGNILVLIVVYKSKQLRHSQYVYKCSIAASDIIWSFFTSSTLFLNCLCLWRIDPRYLIETYDTTNKPYMVMSKNNMTFYNYYIKSVVLQYKYVIYRPSDFLQYFYLCYFFVTPPTLFVSLITLVIASKNRVKALKNPIKYRLIDNTKKAKKNSVLVWVLSTVIFAFLAQGVQFDSPLGILQPEIVQYGYDMDRLLSIRNNVIAITLFILTSLLWYFTFLTLYSLYKSYKRSFFIKSKN